MTNKHCLLLGGLLFVTSLIGPALAAEPAPSDAREDDFFLALGAHLLSFNTEARASGGNSGGADIDLQSVLGLEDSNATVRLDGYWRFARKHRLDFAYLFERREGSRDINRSFEFDGSYYDVGAGIDSAWDMQYLKASYRYSVLKDDRIDIGLSIGITTFLFGVELEGQGTAVVNGQPAGTAKRRFESTTLVAPVPNIGIHGAFALTRKLTLRQSWEFFDVDYQDYSGRYTEVRAVLDWFFAKHFGIGGGFDRTTIEFSKKAENEVGVDFEFSGAVFYAVYSH